MKTKTFLSLAAVSSLCLLQPAVSHSAELSAGVSVEGDVPAPQSHVEVAPQPTGSAGIKLRLPNGVDDVLKLCRGEVNEEVVVAYIHNSGTAYSLHANDIVYLKQQGVSDRIVTAMLEQKQHFLASQPAAPAQVAPSYTQPENYQTQPAATYVQPPSSSVYVIPNTGAYYNNGYSPYYYGSPYYGGYYGSYYGGYGATFGLAFGYGGYYGHNYGHGSYGGHGGYGHGGYGHGGYGHGGYGHGGYGHGGYGHGGYGHGGYGGHSSGGGYGGHGGLTATRTSGGGMHGGGGGRHR